MALQSPVVELFSIGTELVYGQIQDTNSFWMAQQIVQLGGKVRRITQLTDDYDDIRAALEDSIARGTDLLITSGGLGPTPDDLTHQVVADVAGTALIVHEDVIADYMVRRNIASREEVSPNLVRMATVPASARVLLNPVGWAPCCCVEVEGALIVTLPGPPREMEAVFMRHVVPLISERYEVRAARLRVLINTYESAVAPLFQELMEAFPGSYIKGYIALNDRPGWLPVDILATGADAAEAQNTLQAIVDALRKRLAEQGKQLTVYAEAADPDSLGGS